MPSQFCIQHPFNFNCVDPNYNPTPVNDPFGNQGYPWPVPGNNSGGGNTYPSGTITTGGATINNGGQLQTILNGILSGFAIWRGATHVPTTIPVTQPAPILYNPYPGGIRDGNNYYPGPGGDGTAAGKVEQWVKQNTGVVLIGSAIVVAYLMKSPRGR